MNIFLYRHASLFNLMVYDGPGGSRIYIKLDTALQGMLVNVKYSM